MQNLNFAYHSLLSISILGFACLISIARKNRTLKNRNIPANIITVHPNKWLTEPQEKRRINAPPIPINSTTDAIFGTKISIAKKQAYKINAVNLEEEIISHLHTWSIGTSIARNGIIILKIIKKLLPNFLHIKSKKFTNNISFPLFHI